MPKPATLVCLKDPSEYETVLRKRSLLDRLDVTFTDNIETLDQSAVKAAEILLAWNLPEQFLSRMPALRWIQAMTAGVEHWLARTDIDVRVVLTCARGSHRVQMPENILASLFHLAKPLYTARQNQLSSEWISLMSEPLAGKTLGIVGLGAVGVELAKKAAALELDVIGCKRTVEPVAGVRKVYRLDKLDALLAESDFVVLLLPVTPLTDNLMNAERFKAMKPGAWLLNFGRGPLVVDEDVIDAVNTGEIAGAVLDVFREEPLPASHAFWQTENIVVLPHLGGLHPGRDQIVAELFADNIQRYLQGKPLAAVVDRKHGY